MPDEKPTIKSTAFAYLYLLPALVILGVFSLYPVVRSLMMGFTTIHWRTFEVSERGFHNFQWLFWDERFALALRNTFTFVIGVVPASILISLGIAVLLNSKIKGAGIFRSIYFLPFVTSTIAIAMVWSWIYNTNHGILNYVLGFLGMDAVRWIEHPDHAMTALIIMSIWSSLGFNIIILLAGLQTINPQLYLAARVDGARPWRRFLTVTIPMLSPSLFFVSVIGVINSFRVFGEVYALFAQGQNATPGPAGSALTVVYFIYERFYEMRQFGRAAAAAVVLFAIILIFTLAQFLVGKKLVHYK
jgi:multiple sugar transport system permease protein